MTEFTRFDVPETFGRLIDAAITIGILDGKDVVALVISNGMNFGKIVDEVVGYAFASRHCNNSHEKIVPYADHYWAAERKSS